MEDDWDLHAVVRGCTATSVAATTATTATHAADSHQKVFISQDLSSVVDPFEARSHFEELHELYRPFFPKSPSLSSQTSAPVSFLSSFVVSKDLHHGQAQLRCQEQQQKKESQLAASVTSVISTASSNSTAANSHTPRSKRRWSSYTLGEFYRNIKIFFFLFIGFLTWRN